MPMPEANIFFENLPRKANITLEGSVNQYYVHTAPNGCRSLVIMEGNKQREQQTALDAMVRATKRRAAK